MVNVDIHFIQFLILLALGFISGKFISTSIIQISVWDQVKGLGLKPSFTSTVLIYFKQTFCGWNTNLSPRCLLISLLTSLIFVIFWVRYGINATFVFCCLYSLFGQIYLFAWLDNKDVPVSVTIIFIIIGNISVYYLDQNRLVFSMMFSIGYLIIKKLNLGDRGGSLGKIIQEISSLLFSVIVWFGLSSTLGCLVLSYITATLIRAQKQIKNIHYNYELINPIMCVFFFIYSLFKFPSVL